MTRFAKLALWFAVLVGALLAAAWWQRAAIGTHLMAREIETLTANADPFAALPDGLHVGLCGTGSPMQDERHGGPCTVVVAGKRMFMFDAGSGSVRSIGRMRLNLGQAEALFFTHYHSDHIDGTGELLLQSWAQRGDAKPLPVYGPPGLEPMLQGFSQAYALDKGWRIAHHGEKNFPPAGFGAQARPFELPAATRRVALISEPDLEIVAFAVEHEPVTDAVGYRIRYKNRVVVLSGDTRPSAAMVREAQGADILVHEALSLKMFGMLQNGLSKAGRSRLAQIMHDVPSYHTTPEQAAEIAAQAGVKLLVLSHVIPPVPRGMEPAFIGDAGRIYKGPIHVAADGDWITLRAAGTALQVGQRP
ncbi:MBL fold metallo-hydrolase [Ramlibacter henchirensis]|uniref:MBL fold metallo-hydrolase n=1 Tax=Ramlibacter henchirensis TaxID=204072 RepID=A0A4Z0C4Q1_9BURK|nr:MBL fold metallo-hydrolase [Ramlibacter henchirensis]TFZ05922.1 MBL fold metallo-hydrolase [Ramlibacter henchirensis]